MAIPLLNLGGNLLSGFPQRLPRFAFPPPAHKTPGPPHPLGLLFSGLLVVATSMGVERPLLVGFDSWLPRGLAYLVTLANGELVCNGDRVSGWEGEKVPDMDGGGFGTTVGKDLMLLCGTFKDS